MLYNRDLEIPLKYWENPEKPVNKNHDKILGILQNSRYILLLRVKVIKLNSLASVFSYKKMRDKQLNLVLIYYYWPNLF